MIKKILLFAAIAASIAICAEPSLAQVAAPVAQNTITTTAPVSSETTISVGTIGGQVLTWLAVVFGAPIGALASAFLYRAFMAAGVKMSIDLRDKLQSIIVNGLNKGADLAQQELAGRGTIEIKNAAVAHAVAYAQDHGAETMKALGIDPNSNEAIDVIKARIETAINDVNTPTPPSITPVEVAKAGAA